MDLHLLTLKVGLLSFWGLWLSIVLITNLFEGLKLLRIVPPYWRFASQNFQAIAQATGTYRADPWVPKLLFLGVLCWQCGTLGLFARAIITTSTDGILRLGPVNALTASAGLSDGGSTQRQHSRSSSPA
jgi:hypothetical protein